MIYKEGTINRPGINSRALRQHDRTNTGLLDIAADVTEAINQETRIDDVLHHLQDGLCRMRGNSSVMRRLYETIRKAAPTEARILLVGESGSGKELVADALHQLSTRADKPFIIVNCGAVSSEIMESELFGHEKGAFTGATRSHVGYFERANGGTLFLDEITEMPLDLQVKLLRILETGRFHRVGGETELEVDVRVISATNRDPKFAVDMKLLREDLFFRLSQFPVQVPPLRSRVEDIPMLAEYFLRQANVIYKQDKVFSADALVYLQQCAWPGNVRELKNAIDRACIVGTRVIESRCFNLDQVGGQARIETINGQAGTDSDEDVRLAIGTSISEAEKIFILATFKKNDFDKPGTAKTLGISLKTLYNKLNKYSISSK